MKKAWRVCLYEYLRHVRRKRFLFALLSIPVIGAAAIGIGVVVAFLQYDSRPIGYIDLSGQFINPLHPDAEDDFGYFKDPALVRFPDEKSARSALEDKNIQAYYMIQPDYLENGRVKQVAVEAPSETADSVIRRFLVLNLLEEQSDPVRQRIIEGANVQVHSLDNSREMSGEQWPRLVIPIVAGFMLILVVNTSGGYLLQSVVEEKENRTMEIVITSVSPAQLMTGKIVGNLSVGLTQLLLWLFFPAAALFAAKPFLPFDFSGALDTGFVILTVLTVLPAFVLVAALMATVGATATESREAQQIATVFTLPLMLPFWFFSTILAHPDSPLAVVLSLFPLTAPATLPLRAAFTQIPIWQSTLSIVILFLSAVGALWLAGRAFRLGMLRYGKRLTWHELFHFAGGKA